jgi:hypothetical protein
MRAPKVFATLAVPLLLAAACGKSDPSSVLQPEDLDVSMDGPFDPTEIVDPGAFTDDSGIDPGEIQDFLNHTPYNQPSFLSTYQSNGVLASQAIASAAQTYRLNPLVFLVRAQMDQGLVGLETYPSPTSRVDYVFDCGQVTEGQYDPALAGFDIQCDCLGASLRSYLDQVAENGMTAGGWGPGIASTTLDGISVTPQDASTAALYQYEPLVAQGSGGNWLFWSIWQEYANALNYVEPESGPTGGMAAIGDACNAPTDCSEVGSICATGDDYPGGLCTLSCTGDCPNDQVETFCADFGTNGYCLAVCDPNAPTPCRPGYTCMDVRQYMGDASSGQNVCFAN